VEIFGDVIVQPLRFDGPAVITAGEATLDVLVVTGGAIGDQAGDGALRCAAADVLLVAPAHCCRFLAAAGTEAVRYGVGGSLLERLRAHVPRHPLVLSSARIRDVVSRLAAELRRNDASSALAMEAALCDLIARANRLLSGPSLSAEVEAAVRFVREHLGEQIAVAQLAAAANVSSRVLTARFAAELRTSPLEYVRSLRMSEAARRVAESQERFGDLAHRLGFYDHAHFSKWFRQTYGVAPSEYRRRARHADHTVTTR